MSKEDNWLLACLALAAGEAAGFACPTLGVFSPWAWLVALLVALLAYGFAWKAGRFVALAVVGMALALAACERRSEVLASALERNRCRPFEAALDVGEWVKTAVAEDGTLQASFPSAIGSVRIKAYLSVPPGARPPRPGEKWRCVGWLERKDGWNWHERRRFWARGPGTSSARLADAGFWTRCSHRLSAAFSRKIGLGLDYDRLSAKVNRAMLLGERDSLPRALIDDFKASGTIHVFAISGLHVMIVARVFAVLLAVCLVPCRFLAFALAPLLWGYVWMIGSPPSAVRSASMATLYFSAPLFWRRPNGIMAWALTFLGVHLFNPVRLLDVGCEFSFVVMLALALWSRYARSLVTSRFDGLAVSVVAWAAGVPIAAHAFGQISLGGVIANLVMLPAAFFAVATGVLGALSGFVCHPLAIHLNNLASLFTRLMVGTSRVVASVPGCAFETSHWPLWECLAWYAAMALSVWLLLAVKKRRCSSLA